ncbi:Tctex1 domain-containing protein 2 [Caenorhabditis elegans]|uniref:Tctex1 domain-containing protein 2 n=1 Tax=Caenorhabditis elegans TaxID=6239 RepID=Q18917_CAEEL|nr:Tctex1 domain-containing protein 2 [Caenorhabditis elegans]CCD64418.1 Tctex1 domain-containing protein 2 [Caenorhabditis elegans]|eukprot:NP_509511.1 DYnein Light chain (Tctex type) [Caenorhabditis elegans]
MEDANDRNFVLRPTPGQKFRPKAVAGMIQEILGEKLGALTIYNVDEAELVSKDISASIRERLKGLQLPRYKYVIQTMIAEQCGNGATTAVQCVWDEDCDGYLTQRYVTGSIWCEVLVFAIFHY